MLSLLSRCYQGGNHAQHRLAQQPTALTLCSMGATRDLVVLVSDLSTLEWLCVLHGCS